LVSIFGSVLSWLGERLICYSPSSRKVLEVPLSFRRNMGKRMYVGNLSYQTTETDLTNLFEQIGPVESANIITDRDTGRSKGFGFVEMSNEDAEKAIAQFNGTELNGRALTVNEARPREERSGGGGRGGYGGGRGGRGGGGGGGRGGYGNRYWSRIFATAINSPWLSVTSHSTPALKTLFEGHSYFVFDAPTPTEFLWQVSWELRVGWLIVSLLEIFRIPQPNRHYASTSQLLVRFHTSTYLWIAKPANLADLPSSSSVTARKPSRQYASSTINFSWEDRWL
jgi:cold-inducible RNA-binding protein